MESWAVIVTGWVGDFYDGSMAAYDALNQLGYNIRYLDVVDRGDGRFNDYATKNNVQYAIGGWLAVQSDSNDICVLYFSSHGDGTDGGFLYLYPEDNLAYSEIAQYLSYVQYSSLIIVVDACYSETCIDDLSGTNRIVISSGSADQEVGISLFSEYFWPKAATDDLMDAFNNAAWETWNYTTHFPIIPDPQKPKLDDNGDGVGHWTNTSPLPTGGDGYFAWVTYLDTSKMANLIVEAKGFKADGSIETLTGVNVAINEYINRSTPVSIVLAKGDYTVEVPKTTKIGGVTWYFEDWEDGSTINPRSLTLSDEKTITANYADTIHTLSIAVIPDSCGTTDPAPGTHTYLHGRNVTVKAIANVSHYGFDYWVLDGTTVYGNPITVLMGANHSLEAHFKWVNNPPQNSAISGPSTGDVGVSYTYTACTIDPEGDNVRYWLDWGDGSVTTTGWCPSGTEVLRSHSWSSDGGYVVRVKAQDIYGAWSGWSGLVVVIGEACPYVYAWNGSAYVLDNNVLAESEVNNGSDVEDLYKLEQAMAPYYTGDHFSVYSLMLGEFENEHSFIDQVKLYAVDHDSDVNIALTPDGQILTYSDPNPLVSAVDNYGYDWLSSLSEADDIYYRGFPGDYLLLDFGSLDTSQAAKLVLRANLEWKKETCIHVQALNETGEWMDVAKVRTRNRWSTIIVDLANYLPNPDGSLKIRLCMAGVHRIDFVGLDTTMNEKYAAREATLFYAEHSGSGRVTLKLLKSDDIYAELVPGEQIRFYFISPNKPADKNRSFIIQVEGHYYDIQ